MYSINLTRYIEEPRHCAGGWDTERNEYDFAADAYYHSAYPDAPTCVNGLLTEVEVLPIKGFLFDTLTAAQIEMTSFGNLNVGESIFIVDGLTDLTNSVSIEYPETVHHMILFCRPLIIADVTVAQYAKVKLMETPDV